MGSGPVPRFRDILFTATVINLVAVTRRTKKELARNPVRASSANLGAT